MRFFLHSLIFLFAFDAWALLLYRVDNNPLNEVNGSGTRKSFITPQGSLSPANPQGQITVLDHIARSRKTELKSNSQFTSFSSRADLGEYYGEKNATIMAVDVDRLSRDINRGLVKGVKIHTTKMIVTQFENALTSVTRVNSASPEVQTNFKKELWDHIKTYYSMVREKGVPQEECDIFFWNGVNAFRERYPSLFNGMSETTYKTYSYLFNGLRHVYTDEEWLVEGVIPKEYFTRKKLSEMAASITVSVLNGEIEQATAAQVCD